MFLPLQCGRTGCQEFLFILHGASMTLQRLLGSVHYATKTLTVTPALCPTAVNSELISFAPAKGLIHQNNDSFTMHRFQEVHLSYFMSYCIFMLGINRLSLKRKTWWEGWELRIWENIAKRLHPCWLIKKEKSGNIRLINLIESYYNVDSDQGK